MYLTAQEMIELVQSYDEWTDIEDETGVPTGYVCCPICDGGGTISIVSGKHSKKDPPTHTPECLRFKFEQAMKGQ